MTPEIVKEEATSGNDPLLENKTASSIIEDDTGNLKVLNSEIPYTLLPIVIYGLTAIAFLILVGIFSDTYFKLSMIFLIWFFVLLGFTLYQCDKWLKQYAQLTNGLPPFLWIRENWKNRQ